MPRRTTPIIRSSIHLMHTGLVASQFASYTNAVGATVVVVVAVVVVVVVVVVIVVGFAVVVGGAVVVVVVVVVIQLCDPSTFSQFSPCGQGLFAHSSTSSQWNCVPVVSVVSTLYPSSHVQL